MINGQVSYPNQNVSVLLNFDKESSQDNAAFLINAGVTMDDALSIELAFRTILKHHLVEQVIYYEY